MRTLLITTIIMLAGSLAAEDKVLIGFEPGCFAKIYPLGTAKPTGKIPDAASQVIRLEEGPNVECSAKDPDYDGQANRLLYSKLLETSSYMYYIVEYEGWIQAKVDGSHTFTAQSDERVEIFVEGRPIARPPEGTKFSSLTKTAKPALNPVSGSANLAAGKWYHVAVVAHQTFAMPNTYRQFDGAHLKTWLQVGDEKAKSIPFHLPLYDE